MSLSSLLPAKATATPCSNLHKHSPPMASRLPCNPHLHHQDHARPQRQSPRRAHLRRLGGVDEPGGVCGSLPRGRFSVAAGSRPEVELLRFPTRLHCLRFVSLLGSGCCQKMLVGRGFVLYSVLCCQLGVLQCLQAADINGLSRGESAEDSVLACARV